MSSIQQIAMWLGLRQERQVPISSFAIDSRNVQPGGLFFALPGARVDGHMFLEEVARKGGFAAVVRKEYRGPDFGLVLLKVDDVLAALQEMARAALVERKTKVIGITGSIGKTTTKEFIAEVLCRTVRLHKTVGNQNSQCSFPLTILQAFGDEDFLLLEYSMTEAGHIAKLVSIAPPDIVVMTPIAMSHVKNFADVEGIAREKASIFTMKTEFAVIHAKSAQYKAVQERCLCDNIIYPQPILFPTPFTERHFLENVSAAVEVGRYLGVPEKAIEQGVQKMQPFAHRFEKKQYRGITFVDDTYNANPQSSIAALQNLPKPAMGKKTVVVFGAMADMGRYSFAVHTEVAKEALRVADLLYCIGEEAKPMVAVFEKHQKPVQWFSSYEALEEAIHLVAEAGDVVLVKGSNYHNLWKIIK